MPILLKIVLANLAKAYPTHTHTHILTWAHTHTHVHMSTHTHTYTHTHTHMQSILGTFFSTTTSTR